MRLLHKWRKKRELRYIPSELIFEPLYRTLDSFHEDIGGSIKISKKEFPQREKVSILRKQIKKKPRVRKDIVYKSHYGGLSDVTYKVVLFGDPEVEKDHLTQRYLDNLFKSDTKMTIGVDFEVKSLKINDKKVKLQIWDFNGEERFRYLLSTYARGANGALFIYNAANYNTLAHIDEWLFVVRREIKSERDIFPIVVVGIVPEFDERRRISTELGIKIARSRGVDGFVEWNPRTGENVEETFEALTRLMLVRSGIKVAL
ncbi:MAG: Rab family GTPase [Candidatus Thorarchaeota archaeon]